MHVRYSKPSRFVVIAVMVLAALGFATLNAAHGGVLPGTSSNVSFKGLQEFGDSPVVAVNDTGTEAYMFFDGSFVVIDVSNKSLPSKLGLLPLAVPPSNIQKLAYFDNGQGGHFVYACAGVDGMTIIDVTNPQAPAVVSVFDDPSYSVTSCVVRSVGAFDVAYLATSGGLVVVDVTIPTAPTEMGSVNTPGSSRDVVVAYDYAYIADGYNGLRVIDVSDPTAPVEVGAWDQLPSGQFAGGVDVDPLGQFVFLACTDALRMILVTDPVTPTVADELAGGGQEVAYGGARIYLTAGSADLVAITNDIPMVEEYRVPMLYSADVALSGFDYQWVYGADREVGLLIIDSEFQTSNPFDRIDGVYESGGHARGVDVADFGCGTGTTTFAYVAAGESGQLRVIDVSDPSDLFVAGYFDVAQALYTSYNAWDVVIKDPAEDLVFLSGRYPPYGAVLQITACPVPEIPFYSDTYSESNTVAPIVAVAVDPGGDYVYMAQPAQSGDPGRIRSLSVNPLARKSTLETTDAWDLAVVGDLLLVADGAGGLRIVDVSDPLGLATIAAYDTRGTAQGVAATATHAYVADGAELVVVDITTPASPEEVGSIDLGGDAYKVAVSGDYAYVADQAIGMRVVDVSDPACPYEVGFYDAGPASDVALFGGDVYATFDGFGLAALEFTPTQSTPPCGGVTATSFAYKVSETGPYGEILDRDPFPMPAFSARGCPAGDLDYVLVEVTTPGQSLSAEDITLSQTLDGISTFYDLVSADGPTNAGNGYMTTLTVTRFGGCNCLPACTHDRAYVRINGTAAAEVPIAVQGPDGAISGSSNGIVDALDFGEFGNTWHVGCPGAGFPCYNQCYDIMSSGSPEPDGVVNSVDFTIFGNHWWHQVPGYGQSTSPLRPQAKAKMRLIPEVLDGQVVVRVVVENVVDARTIVAKVAFGERLQFDGWEPSEKFPGASIGERLSRPGSAMLGAFSTDGLTSKAVEIGMLSLRARDSAVDVDLAAAVHVALGEIVDGDGETMRLAGATTVPTERPMAETSLRQNHPNPFNPTTTIEYAIAGRSHVSLRVYNVRGQLVRTLVDGTKEPNTYRVEWDGRDRAGRGVASGIYFYRLVAGDFTATRKMVLLK